MIMFDACYNGSFHENDYIAGQYIFNDGQTLVAQGNTRNVLQDRWTIEMIGLLSHGVRAGQYNKLIASLEVICLVIPLSVLLLSKPIL